jgi:hypothetical protein
MNKFALLPFFLVLFYSAKAQDKIISMTHDTIHCTILSISNERILYELKNNDGSVTGKFMSLSQVEGYSRSQLTAENSKMRKLKTPKPAYIPENPWCLGLNAGRSAMPWYFDNIQSSSAMPDYYNKLKTGFHINANAHYMIKSFLGLGVEYSFFKTSTSGSMQVEYPSSVFLMESEKYRLYTNYLGASVLFQQHLDAHRKFILSESLSAGVLFIRMENQSTSPNASQSGYNDISNNMLLTGNSFSGKLGLTAEYRLFEAVSVGLGGDFIWCSLKKASFESKGSNNYSSSSDKQELSNPMKLSRIDYSFVLRYYF